MEKRMTGSDYFKELSGITAKQKILNVQISKRINELVGKYPDAIINRVNNVDIKASSLNPSYLDSLSDEKKVFYITLIEKWSAEKEKYKQGELF